MNDFFAVVAAVMFVLSAGEAVTRKFHIAKINRFMGKIHCPAGIIFIVAAIVHFSFNIRLIGHRPGYVFILGILGLVFGLTAVLSGIFRKRIGKKWLAVHRITSLCLCICIALHVSSYFYSLNVYRKSVADIRCQAVDISKIPDGVYTGDCDVTYIYAKVAVTVKSGRIAKVDILEHKNERGGRAEIITGKIVAEQRVNVDAVTGATNSSKVIEKAVDNALIRAEGEKR